jgi:hypothetical protein
VYSSSAKCIATEYGKFKEVEVNQKKYFKRRTRLTRKLYNNARQCKRKI